MALPTYEDLCDLDRWERPDGPVEIKRLRARDEDPSVLGVQTGWLSHGQVRPSDLYRYLKARFGAPVGLLSLMRERSSDNLFHWHFFIVVGEGSFEAMSSNRGTEFRVRAATALSEQQQRDLIDLIKQDFAQHGQAMKVVGESLERWSVFSSPFRRLADILSEMYDELESAIEKAPEEPEWPRAIGIRRGELDAFMARFGEWTQSVAGQHRLVVTIEMLLPVYIESFVNFLFFCLAKPEMRAGDGRLYEARLRDQVDVRVRSLHQVCRGFAQPVDPDTDEFRDFQSIMNRRNDLLHGNTDPRLNRVDEVFFDDRVFPVFREEDSQISRMIRRSLSLHPPADTLKRVESATEFIFYVLSCLRDKPFLQMMHLLHDPFPGWREDEDRVGALFSVEVGAGFPIATDE